MIKIIGKELWRGGQKIGYVSDHHVCAHDGKKLGYFHESFVFGESGHKLAEIKGDHLISYGGHDEVPLEKVSEHIEGGVMEEIEKCAIYVLLGD